MKWNKIRQHAVSLLGILGYAMLVMPALYCSARVLLADSFIVPTESMEPALSPGDRIWAWKLKYGARIYSSLDFSGRCPHCFRIPGVGRIRQGDIVVFNSPKNGTHGDSIWFTVNDVCCKRVAGCPGDRIGAVDGHCWNDKVMKPIGCRDSQELLRWTYDSIFVWNGRFEIFPEAGMGWNIKNWGPLTVPARGMKIDTSIPRNAIYRSAVEYETGLSFDMVKGEYVFRHDWFFVLGDNSPLSFDSRFFGFVPDDFVIGVLCSRRGR